jgi:Ca-activated chloride channel family protein
MNQPTLPTYPVLSFRSLRPALASDQPNQLDLLLKIEPPEQSMDGGQQQQRPPLNLALVIDRSGSMTGRKLSHARKAARFLVEQLSSRDRLAIVTFDDEAEVVMPSQPVRDPQPFLAAINRIRSGRSTDLFAGWRTGALQVAEHLDAAGLNRVLLLSDGHTNRGLRDSEQIGELVSGLCQRGVSTSAFGLGRDFDEDLMGAIATGGEGTLAHLEAPEQLEDLYASELQGLAVTLGRQVKLRIKPCQGAELTDVLNDLPGDATGGYRLPSLRYGQALNIAMQFALPAWQPNQPIATVTLEWIGQPEIGEQQLCESVQLPVLTAADLKEMVSDAVVEEEFAVIRSNRARRLAMQQLDRGDVQGAETTLGDSTASMMCLSPSLRTTRELQLLQEKRQLLRRDRNAARKGLSKESLRSSLEVWENHD